MHNTLDEMPPQQALFLAIAFSDRMPDLYLGEIEKAVTRGASVHTVSQTGETPLTAAILDGMGSPGAVHKLLELGADATQIDNNGWCPWAACHIRKTDPVVADEMQQIETLLLGSGIDPEQQPPAPESEESEPSVLSDFSKASSNAFPAKFSALFVQNTHGINSVLDTEDIVKKLMDWDQRYGIEISDVSADGLSVKFLQLASAGQDLEHFCQEIYGFCPDVIDQGFGCMDDMMEMMKESGIEIDEATRKLVAGVNFAQEDFGLTLLGRSLLADHTLTLWWD